MTHLTAETLDLYLDNELDAVARLAAEEHLAHCAECRAELVAARDLFTILDSPPARSIPVDLSAAVVQGIRSSRTLDGRVAALALALEAAFAVALGGWLLPLAGVPALSGLQTLLPSIDLAALFPAINDADWSWLRSLTDLLVLPAGTPGWPIWLLALLISAAWLATTYMLLAGSQNRNSGQEREVAR